jgi:type I restriction enzyme S subunit
MVVDKGYKQTEVGVIPEDWDALPISEIAVITTGGSDTQDRIDDGEFPFFVRSQNVERINKYTMECEAILTSGDGVGVGKIFHYIHGKFDFHQRVYCIYNFNQSVLGKYLYYQFSTNFFNRVMQLTAKSSVDSVRREMIADMKLPFPKTTIEQTAIANALSDIDALIAQTEKLIEKKKAIKQGVMQELLKPKEGWVTKKLGEVGMCLRGVSYSPETDLDLDENENNLSLLRSNNIQDGLLHKNNLQFVKSHIVKEFQIIKDSDIIICMANGSKQLVGKAAIIDNIKRNRYTYGAFMGCFRVNSNNNPNFIFALMESKQYRDYIDILLAGSSINNLNPGAIESMSFQIPDRSIQDSIAELLGDIQKSIIKNQAKLQKLKYKKQGMMQALLTGKIRLIC